MLNKCFTVSSKTKERQRKRCHGSSKGTAHRAGARCSNSAARRSPTDSQVTLSSVLTRKPASCAKSRTSSRFICCSTERSHSRSALRPPERSCASLAHGARIAMTHTEVTQPLGKKKISRKTSQSTSNSDDRKICSMMRLKMSCDDHVKILVLSKKEQRLNKLFPQCSYTSLATPLFKSF